LNGNHKSLNIILVNLFIIANIIRTQKNISKLFSKILNLLAPNLACKSLVDNVVSLESENKELNSMNIEGILIKSLRLLLFNNAKTITQI